MGIRAEYSFLVHGVFSDATNVLVEFAFTTMHIERLEARMALRNRRAHARRRE